MWLLNERHLHLRSIRNVCITRPSLPFLLPRIANTNFSINGGHYNDLPIIDRYKLFLVRQPGSSRLTEFSDRIHALDVSFSSLIGYKPYNIGSWNWSDFRAV